MFQSPGPPKQEQDYPTCMAQQPATTRQRAKGDEVHAVHAAIHLRDASPLQEPVKKKKATPIPLCLQLVAV